VFESFYESHSACMITNLEETLQNLLYIVIAISTHYTCSVLQPEQCDVKMDG